MPALVNAKGAKNIAITGRGTIDGLRVKMLAENRPDKRATHALVMERVQGLRLRDVEVGWDEQAPEPSWGSALFMRDVSGLLMEGSRGRPAAGIPRFLPSRKSASRSCCLNRLGPRRGTSSALPLTSQGCLWHPP